MLYKHPNKIKKLLRKTTNPKVLEKDDFCLAVLEAHRIR